VLIDSKLVWDACRHIAMACPACKTGKDAEEKNSLTKRTESEKKNAQSLRYYVS
jgi:hypothetical protein